MSLPSRARVLSVALVASTFASCVADLSIGDANAKLAAGLRRIAPALHAAARRARSDELVGDAGKWPKPSAQQLAQLQADSAAVRPASLRTGDVLSDEPELDDAPVDTDELSRGSLADAPTDADAALAAIAKETFVYAAPGYGSKKIGYLRGGAIVKRAPEPAGNRGCPGGWYRIAPQGFVCVGSRATLDVKHPLVTAAVRRPDRLAALPYAYGMSSFPTPPFYTKVPTPREQAMVEQDLTGHLREKLDPGWLDVNFDAVPDLISAGQQVMTWNGSRHSPSSLYSGRALPKSGFAFIDFFEAEGRKLGLTVDLDVVPLDRMKRVRPSEFHGITLDDETTLPVVFVMSKFKQLMAGDPRKGGLHSLRPLGYREALPIKGKKLMVAGKGWYETTTGDWVRDEDLVRVDPIKNKPGWATPGRTWVDVSILKQALIAYEGTKPVYVTLVSTGADGLGDPKETHSTVRGQFLIHTKHVTATMSGDELGDEFDLRDVPYVQYFKEGYALHAAYWHDSFGRPRSHGCVNLSPLDARWLFHWTDPPVPQSWHGAMSLHEGTLVYVHP
jgi:hypothetical protein